MTTSMRFEGELVFESDREAIEVLRRLAEEDDDEGWSDDVAFAWRDLRRKGARVAIDVEGSFPASFWDATTSSLQALANEAKSGEIRATYDNVEEGGPPLVELIRPEPRADSDEDRRVRVFIEGSLEEVRAELETGADLESALELHMSSEKPRDPRILVLFFDAGLGVDQPDRFDRTLLGWAAGVGDLPSLNLLLDRGANPNGGLPLHSPLHKAARAGSVAAIERLLAAGADLHAEDFSGTALQRAMACRSKRGRKAAIEVLLRAGANLRTKNNKGVTALAYAKRYGVADEALEIAKEVAASKKNARPKKAPNASTRTRGARS
ncbi:MAG: ankyrin repeat domain-containing protein [Polyangiaceae bacterium]